MRQIFLQVHWGIARIPTGTNSSTVTMSNDSRLPPTLPVPVKLYYLIRALPIVKLVAGQQINY